MKRSTDRILTTHTGSLPRDPRIFRLIAAREKGEPASQEVFDATAREVIRATVDRQLEIGLDVINDGEQSKPSYVTYMIDRLAGFGAERRARYPTRLDSADYPDWARSHGPRGVESLRVPTCTAPLEWSHFDLVEADLAILAAAVEDTSAHEVFLSAASPGVISTFLPNEYYASDRDYLEALARVMSREYEAIVAAGFLLQIDCPDLAMSRHSEYSACSLEEFKDIAIMHVEILNRALENISPDRLRMHVCWGNYEGPHNHDVPLREMLPIILEARPQALCLEGSNPRHGHEWQVWRDVELPVDKTVITGCLDTTTNFIEHPQLVCDRIVRYAGVVGRENVIAGTDCGFGSMMGLRGVEANVAWGKLAALVEGAALASRELW